MQLKIHRFISLSSCENKEFSGIVEVMAENGKLEGVICEKIREEGVSGTSCLVRIGSLHWLRLSRP